MAVRLDKQESIGHIVLDRPPANSYDKGFMEELDAAIEEARGDDTVKAIVVRSANERFFSAGADVSVFAKSNLDAQNAFVVCANEAIGKFEQTPKIVVAAINGHCLGGGLEIALCCDFRIAAAGCPRRGYRRPGRARGRARGPYGRTSAGLRDGSDLRDRSDQARDGAGLRHAPGRRAKARARALDPALQERRRKRRRDRVRGEAQAELQGKVATPSIRRCEICIPRSNRTRTACWMWETATLSTGRHVATRAESRPSSSTVARGQGVRHGSAGCSIRTPIASSCSISAAAGGARRTRAHLTRISRETTPRT